MSELVGNWMFDEIIPVRDIEIRVRIPDNANLQRIYAAPDGADLEFRIEGAFVIVTVPQVDIHRMLVMEFRPEGE